MKHINIEERVKINEYVNKGKSLRQIGVILGRHHSSISRELRRNSFVNNTYNPFNANSLALKRTTHIKANSKLLTNPYLQEYVLSKLKKEHYSPALIAHQLKTNFCPHKGYISHESIYRFIYTYKKDYAKFLLTKRQRRNNRIPKRYCSNILFRNSIHMRPSFINDRLMVGHWESDTVEFSKKSAYLSVQVERSTGFVSIRKVASKSAHNTLFALKQTKKNYKVLSVTFDNGTEGAWHYKLNVPTFFCDPYASWQKGLVEYTNRLIRLFFPRNTNPQSISHSDVAQVQFLINSRPRARLGFKSPLDFLHSISKPSKL
jgi:IS30 family transposase